MFVNLNMLLALAGVFSGINNSFAQAVVKSEAITSRNKSFVLYVGGGVSAYTARINTQPIGLQTNINRVSPAATLRIMWHPQYRLRLGLETGYTDFYSYNLKNGNTKGDVSLTAIPILITWSMPVVKRLSIYAGFGSYFLTSRLNYNGKVKSTTFSLGSNFALAYVQPISKNLQLAAEVKWMDAFETRDHALSIQTQLAWTFLEW